MGVTLEIVPYLIAAGGVFLKVTAAALWKKLYNVRATAENEEDRFRPLHHWGAWYWGIFCYCAGIIFSGAIEMDAAVEPLALLFAIIYARYYLNEPLSLRDLISYQCIFFGAVVLGFANIVDREPDTDEFGWTVKDRVFRAFYCILALVLYALIVYFRREIAEGGLGAPGSVRARKVLPVLYAMLISSIQAVIWTALLVIAHLFRSGGEFLMLIIMISVLSALLGLVFVEIYWMHVALRDFDLIFIIPMFFIALHALETLGQVVLGDALTSGVAEEIVWGVILPAVGLSIMTVGACLFAKRENFSAYHLLGEGPDVGEVGIAADPRLSGAMVNDDDDDVEMMDAEPAPTTAVVHDGNEDA